MCVHRYIDWYYIYRYISYMYRYADIWIYINTYIEYRLVVTYIDT